jgi:predicted dehydrogenase
LAEAQAVEHTRGHATGSPCPPPPPGSAPGQAPPEAAPSSPTQISVGEENALSIRVYGELGGLEWRQQEPNTLLLKWPDRPVEIVRTGTGWVGSAAAGAARIPQGHPEGFLEAFANVYRSFANHIRAVLEGRDPDSATLDYPKIADGIRGMSFIEAAVDSSKNNARWTALSL